MALVRTTNYRRQRNKTKRHYLIRKNIAPKKSVKYRPRRLRQKDFTITADGYVVRLHPGWQ